MTKALAAVRRAKRVIRPELTAEYPGDWHDLAEAMERDFRGVISRDASKIVRYVADFINDRIAADPVKCRVCGCSEHRACAGGCSWVEVDLCSRCA